MVFSVPDGTNRGLDLVVRQHKQAAGTELRQPRRRERNPRTAAGTALWAQTLVALTPFLTG